MEQEKWKKLKEKGYENYSISNFGRVKNTRTDIILKPYKNNFGYNTVNLYNTIIKKQKIFSIHRLVALYFVKGNKSLIVNHKDGNKLNNNYTNLEWVTYSENNSHAYRMNLRTEAGIKNPANIYRRRKFY
jgi:hypothetical protein